MKIKHYAVCRQDGRLLEIVRAYSEASAMQKAAAKHGEIEMIQIHNSIHETILGQIWLTESPKEQFAQISRFRV